jgi:hypothetical protein
MLNWDRRWVQRATVLPTPVTYNAARLLSLEPGAWSLEPPAEQPCGSMCCSCKALSAAEPSHLTRCRLEWSVGQHAKHCHKCAGEGVVGQPGMPTVQGWPELQPDRSLCSGQHAMQTMHAVCSDITAARLKSCACRPWWVAATTQELPASVGHGHAGEVPLLSLPWTPTAHTECLLLGLHHSVAAGCVLEVVTIQICHFLELHCEQLAPPYLAHPGAATNEPAATACPVPLQPAVMGTPAQAVLALHNLS